jgi:F1F0 ATPase subunit 2
MSELLPLLASFIAGVLLGLLFFWGLWTSLRRLDRAPHPARRLLGSYLLRFALLLVAFYFLVRYGGWQHLVSAVLGFTLARILVIRHMAPRRGGNRSDA